MKYSFLTTTYKGGHIHTCYNRETKQTEYRAQVGQVAKDCRTMQGSKRAVTALLREQKAGTGPFIGA